MTCSGSTIIASIMTINSGAANAVALPDKEQGA